MGCGASAQSKYVAAVPEFPEQVCDGVRAAEPARKSAEEAVCDDERREKLVLPRFLPSLGATYALPQREVDAAIQAQLSGVDVRQSELQDKRMALFDRDSPRVGL